MKDIFNIYYEALSLIVFKIRDKYQGDEKILEELVLLLTSDNSSFENDLKEIINDFSCEYGKFSKRVLISIMLEKAYLLNCYDLSRGINSEYANDKKNILESINTNEGIELFVNNYEFALNIVDSFLEYLDRPYIFKYQSKNLILSSKLINKLLNICPFAIFDLFNQVAQDRFIQSEIQIQEFCDMYNKAYSYVREDILDEKDCYNSEDEYLATTFINSLNIYFNYDINEIGNFLHYILGNIYEALVTFKNLGDFELREYFDLIPLLEKSKVVDIINKFLNDTGFAIRIINCFVDSNAYLEDYDLLERRDIFKKYGNVNNLKRLNPHYVEEEYAFSKIKKRS